MPAAAAQAGLRLAVLVRLIDEDEDFCALWAAEAEQLALGEPAWLARLAGMARAGLERALCDDRAAGLSQALRLVGLLAAGRPRPVDEFAGMTVEQALEKQVVEAQAEFTAEDWADWARGAGPEDGAEEAEAPEPGPLFPPAPTATVVPWPARAVFPPGRSAPEGPAVVLPFPERPEPDW